MDEDEQSAEPLLEQKHVEEYTLDDAIETIGAGKFHVLFFSLTGFAWIAESMELMVLSILSPILMCEWSLSAYEEAMIATSAFSGMAFGSVVWGLLSDIFGRKKILIGCFSLVLLFGILSSQAPSYTWMLGFQFALGFSVGGGPQIAVIVTETLPLKHRGSGAFIMLAFFWAFGSVFTVAIAMATVNAWSWRFYLLVVLSPLVVFLLGSYWIPESPRYLLTSGRVEELKALLERMAEVNGKPILDGKVKPVKVKTKSGSMVELFTEDFLTPAILILLFFTLHYTYHGFVLLTASMRQTELDGCHPYYTSSFNSTGFQNEKSCKQFSGRDYRHIATTTLAEIPAVLVTFILIDRIGRRKAMLTQLAIATVSFLLLSLCTKRAVLVVFMFIARGLVMSCIQTAHIYAAEVFPTNVRAVGVGLVNLFGRVGAILTPIVADVLIHRSFYFVVLAYALPLVLCICASLLLRVETNQRVLQDSAMSSKDKPGNSYKTLE